MERAFYPVVNISTNLQVSLCTLAHICRNSNIAPFQKFGTIRADLIEQMRFKQRLKVIQTLEDTTKRNVVSPLKGRGQGDTSLSLSLCTFLLAPQFELLRT